MGRDGKEETNKRRRDWVDREERVRTRELECKVWRRVDVAWR